MGGGSRSSRAECIWLSPTSARFHVRSPRPWHKSWPSQPRTREARTDRRRRESGCARGWRAWWARRRLRSPSFPTPPKAQLHSRGARSSDGLERRHACTRAPEPPVHLLYTWLHLRRKGIDVRLTGMPGGPVWIEELLARIDRHTHVVSVLTMSYSTGARLDMAELSAAYRARSALLVVDAVQRIMPASTRSTLLWISSSAPASLPSRRTCSVSRAP